MSEDWNAAQLGENSTCKAKPKEMNENKKNKKFKYTLLAATQSTYLPLFTLKWIIIYLQSLRYAFFRNVYQPLQLKTNWQRKYLLFFWINTVVSIMQVEL